MGIFHKSETRSIDSVNGAIPYFEILTQAVTTEPEYVGIQSLRNSDVFTAIRIIASDIASSPIELFINEEKDNNIALYNLLNVKPNNKMPAFHFKFALVATMLLNGNSYARIVRDSARKPIRLDFIPVSGMSVFADDYNISYQYTDEDGTSKTLKPEDVLHFKYMTVDGLQGLSPLYSLKQEVSMIKSGNNTLLSFFKNGVNGSGILRVNKSMLDKEAKTNIRKEFETVNGGGENSQRTIVLDSTMDYKPLEINTEILKLVNNNVYSTKQIAKAFGIPLDRFGMELVNTSSEDSDLLYVKNTLNPYFNVFTSELNIKLTEKDIPAKQTFVFNTDAMLEVSQQKLIETLSKGVAGTIYTPNEARRKAKLAAIPGLDYLLANQTFASLKEGGIQVDTEQN